MYLPALLRILLPLDASFCNLVVGLLVGDGLLSNFLVSVAALVMFFFVEAATFLPVSTTFLPAFLIRNLFLLLIKGFFAGTLPAGFLATGFLTVGFLAGGF